MMCTRGDELGPFQVLQLLGRGSFGTVLLAEDPRDHGRRVAIKVVPCDHLDPTAAERAKSEALAEAELLQRLRHPHIVACHEVQFDTSKLVVWLALDYMDGGDLQSYISARRARGDLPPDELFQRRVLASVGSALRYIHSHGVLHRDVKSANVLMANELSAIKVADFGISKILEVTGQAHTIVGTPLYMSPELVCGEPYGTASDAWALGVLLYELAATRRPFQADNQLALVRKIVEQPPDALPRSTPTDMTKVILGLLEKAARKRLHLTEALAMSRDIAGLVPLPPPPSFPPPPSPLKVPDGIPVVANPGQVPPEAQALLESIGDRSSQESIIAFVQDRSGGSSTLADSAEGKKGAGLSPRPAQAFAAPEMTTPKKEKARPRTGLSWLPSALGAVVAPRFGIPRMRSVTSTTSNGEPATVISTFAHSDNEDGSGDEFDKEGIPMSHASHAPRL
mmetsp:Transcript_102503/g.265081  ORF Transcript_102503/g.265081 Transcript_102503/m.265081 type:complete len:453 (-) Transcript_102503:93-1451(-)